MAEEKEKPKLPKKEPVKTIELKLSAENKIRIQGEEKS